MDSAPLGTRDRLIRTASRLMTHGGYESTPVKQLVKEAEATLGSLYHFFRKNRGALPAAAVVTLRFVKALLYTVVLAPAALLSRSGRERFAGRAAVLAWHLRGCPANAGLVSAGKETA